MVVITFDNTTLSTLLKQLILVAALTNFVVLLLNLKKNHFTSLFVKLGLNYDYEVGDGLGNFSI